MSTEPDRAWPFAPLVPHHYAVVLADPPWKFVTWSDKGQGKSASQHYPVLTVDEIKSLPVARLAAADAVLMLWATQNTVEQAYTLSRVWGFEPKTLGTWAKQSKTGMKWQFGTGYLLRSAAEFYLFGTRGKPKWAVRNVRNLIAAPVREHSRKPDEMYRDLERLFPDVPRVELFARRPVEGWSVWGNDVRVK